MRVGILTRREVDAADRMREPIDRHVEEYVARLPGKRGGLAVPLHRDNTRRYLRRLAADCRWTCLADLSRDGLEHWMADEARKGRSARSINCHRAAAVTFAHWLADPLIGRLPSNPFGSGKGTAPKADEEADPRQRRRALTPDELARLIAAAQDAPQLPPSLRQARDAPCAAQKSRQCLSGPDRAALYAFLAGTGLRVGEVERLTVADVRLDAVPPHVRVPAGVAKSRREQTVLLRSDLVALLHRRLAGLKPSDPVFPIPYSLIRRFDADSRRAGIPKRDAARRTVDVHSLRTTFVTHLAMAGVTPRVAMELIRHARIDLTMRVYTDPRLLPLAAAVEATASVAPS